MYKILIIVLLFTLLANPLIGQKTSKMPGLYVFHEHHSDSYQVILIDKDLNFWFSNGTQPLVPLKTIKFDPIKHHAMLQFPNSKEIYHVDYEEEPIHSLEWIRPDKQIQSFFYQDTLHSPQNFNVEAYLQKLKNKQN